MASSLALKRIVSSSLLSRSLRPVSSSSSSSRLFNTSAAARDYNDDDRDLGFDQRVLYPFSEVFGPAPLLSRRNDIVKRNWRARESDDGLHLRVDMPGLGKEDVKVSVKHNTLFIEGEGDKETEGGRKYSRRIAIPEKLYKTNEIKGEMKNGVLKLFVPKIKEEERSDVFHVNVE